MNGQWIGAYHGTNDGLLVIEIDDAGLQYDVAVYAMNNDRALPASFGEVSVPKGQAEIDVRVPLFLVERGSGNIFTEEGLKKSHPGLTSAKYADAHLRLSENEIRLQWTTDITTHGSATVTKRIGNEPSTLTASSMSWDEFKAYATNLDRARFLFRGQESNAWKLRTAFHRSGRANLAKFMRQDVPGLYRQLTGLTTHRFNLEMRMIMLPF